MPNEKAPDYTLVCKRVLGLGRKLPPLTTRPLNNTVILDASGTKECGEGE